MHFILYNRFFELFIYAIFLINVIVNNSLPSEKKEEIEDDKKEKKENVGIFLFQTITKIIYIIILIILLIYYSFKYNFTISFLALYYLSFTFGVIKTRKKNINELSYESKIYYINTLMVYLLLFSNHSTNAYINYFSFLPYSLKEYLIIIFIIIKLVFFTFCGITNILILLSNISIIFNNRLRSAKENIKKTLFQSFKFKTYKFLFLKNDRKKIWLLLDIPLYIIICPLLLIYNYIAPILVLFFRWIFEKFFFFIKIVNKYLNNSSKKISKTIKISTIISLIIVYFIIIYSENIISEKTKDFYNLIITVILIPLIYDSIKQK